MNDERFPSTQSRAAAEPSPVGRHVDEHGGDVAPDDAVDAHAFAGGATEARAALDARWRAIGDEIRRYPTPIARCDVQLPALLDARDEVRRLRAIDDDGALVAAYARALAAWGQS